MRDLGVLIVIGLSACASQPAAPAASAVEPAPSAEPTEGAPPVEPAPASTVDSLPPAADPAVESAQACARVIERAQTQRADVMVFVRIAGYPKGYPGAHKDPDYANAERIASRQLFKAIESAKLGESLSGGDPIGTGSGGYTFSVDERGARWLCGRDDLKHVALNEATIMEPGF